MERELLKLLDDFRNGKLDAFGLDCSCSLPKLDEIRAKQEELTQSHFETDIVQDKDGDDKGRDKPDLYSTLANEQFDKLMHDLTELGQSIGRLQQQQQQPAPPSNSSP